MRLHKSKRFKVHKLMALPFSFRKGKRKLHKIEYIVIHYTGNKNDTAKGNAKFFSRGNKRQAGAHFFVDDKSVWRSIPMNRTAYAVGGCYSTKGGAGKFYGSCTNENSVSIELCDAVTGYTKGQVENVNKLLKYITKKCPCAYRVIRHYDVNGKECPKCLLNDDEWKRFLTKITKGVDLI